VDPSPVAPLLKVRELSVSYKQHKAISAFQLDLAPKSCTAIVGYSGSGKSTILKSMVGLVKAQAGEAWLDGDHFLGAGAVTVHPWSLRRQLTLVTQQSGLQPNKTVLGNIVLAAMVVMGITREEAAHRAQEVTAKLGLAEKLGSYPGELSGGQLQRAHLAKALVLEPRVFLLDEITSNVDPRTSEAIGQALQDLHASRGTSMLFISHDFSAVRNLADRVIFLHEGRNFEEVSGQSFPEGFKTAEALAFTTNPRKRVDL